MRVSPLFCRSIVASMVFCAGSSSILAQQITADALSPLTFRHIGPVGNRLSSVSGVVGDPLTYYAGAASGGVWKTTNAGATWVDREVVTDGNLITSRRPGDIPAFNNAVLEALAHGAAGTR